MTTLKRRGLIGGVSATAIAAPSIASAQSVIQWRMATSWPRNLPGPGVTAQRLADRIQAMSAGRIEITLYSAGEIMPALEVLDGVGSGAAHIGHTAAVFWAGKMSAAPFFLAIPFGLTPPEHATWIEHGGGQALWDELYADFNVKPFMAGNTGMSMGGWFRNELTSVSDLKGLRFRMPGLGGQLYQPFGVVQMSMAPGEILQGLQAGGLDAAEFAGPSSDLALGFYKAASYYYWPGIHEPNGTGECLINAGVWSDLPDDLKAVVSNACAAENAFALAEAEFRNAIALKRLVEEKNVQLRRFPDDLIDQARESAAALLQGFKDRGGIEARIHDSYIAILNQLRPWSEISLEAYLGARGG